jgi:hypothetical protein
MGNGRFNVQLVGCREAIGVQLKPPSAQKR